MESKFCATDITAIRNKTEALKKLIKNIPSIEKKSHNHPFKRKVLNDLRKTQVDAIDCDWTNFNNWTNWGNR